MYTNGSTSWTASSWSTPSISRLLLLWVSVGIWMRLVPSGWVFCKIKTLVIGFRRGHICTWTELSSQSTGSTTMCKEHFSLR